MPKIKVKKIPSNVVDRICDCHIHCTGCVLHHVTIVNGLEVHCMRDPRIKSSETIVELPEKDFPTNRDWMKELSNEDFASFLTTGGLLIHGGKYDGLRVSSHLILTTSEALDWLSQPCPYLMEEE